MADPTPDLFEMRRLESLSNTGLILSFIIAGVFWISHHRRLARQPEASRHTAMARET